MCGWKWKLKWLQRKNDMQIIWYQGWWPKVSRHHDWNNPSFPWVVACRVTWLWRAPVCSPTMGLTFKAPLRWGVIKVSKGTWISGFHRAVSQVVLSPGDPVRFQKLLDSNTDLRGSSRLFLIFLGSLWSKNPASICQQPPVRWAPCQVHPWNRENMWGKYSCLHVLKE